MKECCQQLVRMDNVAATFAFSRRSQLQFPPCFFGRRDAVRCHTLPEHQIAFRQETFERRWPSLIGALTAIREVRLRA